MSDRMSMLAVYLVLLAFVAWATHNLTKEAVDQWYAAHPVRVDLYGATWECTVAEAFKTRTGKCLQWTESDYVQQLLRIRAQDGKQP